MINRWFYTRLWQFAPPRQETPQSRTTSPESVRLSKALKARGWKFVGPTTMFAFMQSMGLVNDHLEGCVTRARVEAAVAPSVLLIEVVLGFQVKKPGKDPGLMDQAAAMGLLQTVDLTFDVCTVGHECFERNGVV